MSSVRAATDLRLAASRRCAVQTSKVSATRTRTLYPPKPERRERRAWTDPLVEVVAAKLDGRVGHDPDAVCAISPHETPPSLFPPHLLQRLPDAQLILLSAGALDLEEDLQTLQRRDNRPRHGTCHAARAEGCSKRLGNDLPSLVERRWRWWGNWRAWLESSGL